MSPRTHRLLLIGLLVSAAAVRLPYALYQPGPQRFYDERFSLQNVHALLQEGALKPANGYYATLGYLPQTLVLAAVEKGGGKIYTRAETRPRLRPAQIPGLFTPLAYRLCRGVQVLWGLLSLWLLFRLGQRLVSPECGLLAAWMLACSPWHIRASVVFKPDIVLLATGLLALLAICNAVARSPRLLPYLTVGAAIAAALSSKLTGGLVALPLVAATAFQGRREPRRIFLLAVAGLFSLGVFLLLNPQWELYPRFLERLEVEYEDKAELHGATRWQIPLKAAHFLWDGNGLGGLFGMLALAGFVLVGLSLAAPGIRRWIHVPEDPALQLQRVLVWSYPLLHLALYAWKTPHFKANNVLPLLPIAALLAAWMGLRVWNTAARRLPRPRAVAVGVTMALVLYFGIHAGGWVIERILPTTTDLAFVEMGKSAAPRTPVQLRRLGEEIPQSPWEGWSAHRRPAVVLLPTPPESSVEVADLQRADAVLLLSDRRAQKIDYSSPEAQAFLESLGSRERMTFEPTFGRLRGPTALLALHPWEEIGTPRSIPHQSRLPSIPVEEGRRFVTVEVWVPGLLRPAEKEVPTIQIRGEEEALFWLRRRGEGHLYSTRRVPLPPAGGRLLLLPAEGNSTQGVELSLRQWRQP